MSIEDCIDRAAEMGAKGRETVREKFLITRLLEQHLDLVGGFEPHFVGSEAGT